MSREGYQSGGLDSLPPFESGQWQGFDSPSLIRPGHESRLAVLGGVMALVGFCLPLVGVTYFGAEAPILFSGPQLLEIFPLLWVVPALAGLICFIGIREPEHRGRLLVGLLGLLALAPLALGISQGYAKSPSGISAYGFFGTLAHLEISREARYQQVYDEWETQKNAQAKTDTKDLEDAGDMGDLEDEDDAPEQAQLEQSKPPERPAPKLVKKSDLTVGFYLLLLGLVMAWMGCWPRTEEALAWFERVALVLLLAALLIWAGLPVLIRLDAKQQLFGEIGDTGWMITLSRMSVIWIGMLGASLATRERGHIAIEVLDRFAPRSVCTWLKLVAAVFAVVVLLNVCAAATEYIHLNRSAMLTQLLTDPIPPEAKVQIPRLGLALHEWLFALIFPIGFFVIALRFALLGGQDLLGIKFDHYYGEPR